MTPPQRHSRRDFLRGSSLGQAMGGAVNERFADLPALEMAEDRQYLLSVCRRAMACDFEIQFSAAGSDAHTEHAVAALDLIERLEDQLTIYRDTSEVMEINRRAAEQTVTVEQRLFALFQLAQEIHRETGGAHDATSGPLSQTWGFSRRQGRVPTDEEVSAALERVGFEHLQLDAAHHTVAFLKPGIEVNFNSIGKGYALDRAAELLEENMCEEFLFHGGRSSVLARGRTERGWAIGLRHPLRPDVRVAEIRLHDESLATSGSGTQFFEHEGRRYGHLLDPRTGRPAEGVYSATVVAPTAAQADALSTAFYVMGPEAVAAYCERHPEIRALLVLPGERNDEVELRWFNSKSDPEQA